MERIIAILLKYGEKNFLKAGNLYLNKVLIIHLRECGIFIYLIVRLVLDQKITKRSGFEFGIFSRSMLRNSSFIADFPDGTTKRLFTNIRMNYLTIPLVYKFYSRIANISIGPTLDAYVGWKQVGGTPGVETTEFSTSRKTILGAMAKISKRFTLSEDLILEPDIRLNPLFSVERTYVGAAISLKYRIPKRLISE